MFERQLIDYLPPAERDIQEFNAILTLAEQPEISDSWDAVDNVLNDQFINDATENGVSRLEKIMGVVPKGTETLKERKFTLLTRTSERPPFTIISLERQLKALCGEDNFEMIRDVERKILTVRVAVGAKHEINNVIELLERATPVNMIINVSLKYNQHDAVSIRTHEQLSSFTHDYIRNEVV